MPRALWSGSITFGLVNVPVRLYSAIEEHKLGFRLVHRKDESPIGYQKFCKKEEKPVADDEIVKAFEFKKGDWVFMEDEDFEAAHAEGVRTIDLTDFVPYSDIDPIFFRKTYFVGPQDGAEKVYALLVRAMEDSELAGIAKFVMREQQHLGAIRVRDGVLTLEQLYFADEIRPIDELKPSRAKVDKKELDMATELIESFRSEWKPERYEDTYRDALMDVIKAKRKGEEIHHVEEEEVEEPPDLLEALRASLESTKRRSSRRSASTGSSSSKRTSGSAKRKPSSKRRPARKAA
jgi:DNA end-binding protein Ku